MDEMTTTRIPLAKGQKITGYRGSVVDEGIMGANAVVSVVLG